MSLYGRYAASVEAAALRALRDELSYDGTGRFANLAVGDLIATWPLLAGCPIGFAFVGLLWTLATSCGPSGLYTLAALVTIPSLASLTYVFWTAAEATLASFVAAGGDLATAGAATALGRSFAYTSGLALQNTASCLLTATLLHAILVAVAALHIVPALPLVMLGGRLLLSTPSALIGPCLALLAQVCVVALWLVSGAYLASSGPLEINAYGFGRVMHNVGIASFVPLHATVGVWTLLLTKHLGQIGAAGPLARAYWGDAEARLGRSRKSMLRLALSPLLHVGSAAFGAAACTLLDPLVFVLQNLNVHALDGVQEAGYVSVAAFGTDLPYIDTLS